MTNPINSNTPATNLYLQGIENLRKPGSGIIHFAKSQLASRVFAATAPAFGTLDIAYNLSATALKFPLAALRTIGFKKLNPDRFSWRAIAQHILSAIGTTIKTPYRMTLGFILPGMIIPHTTANHATPIEEDYGFDTFFDPKTYQNKDQTSTKEDLPTPVANHVEEKKQPEDTKPEDVQTPTKEALPTPIEGEGQQENTKQTTSYSLPSKEEEDYGFDTFFDPKFHQPKSNQEALSTNHVEEKKHQENTKQTTSYSLPSKEEEDYGLDTFFDPEKHKKEEQTPPSLLGKVTQGLRNHKGTIATTVLAATTIASWRLGRYALPQ
ncbi:MAG: hypothetical protein ACQEP8_03365 [Chlamydiota bacterium]